MVFTVTRLGGELVATCDDDPRLRGIVWWWSGHALVEYGLRGAGAAGVLNVFDYREGRPRIEFDPETFAAYLASVYRDPDEVTATCEDIAPIAKHGEIGGGHLKPETRPDIIRSDSFGTDPSYIVARLRGSGFRCRFERPPRNARSY